MIRKISIICLGVFLLNSSCTDSSSKTLSSNNTQDSTGPPPRKPPSNFQDTLFINKKAAVFYYPDSVQLEKIRQSSEKWVFEGITHDYIYSMRNAHNVLKQNSPEIKTIEAKNIRYLFFENSNSKAACIDLDSIQDPYGLFLSVPGKEPKLADMMNIETELWFYFENGGKKEKSK